MTLNDVNIKNQGLVGHGFQPWTIEPDQYLLGASALPRDVLQDNGNWQKFLPMQELQQRKIETYGCTIYNSYAAIETLERRRFAENSEYADRFTYIKTGTKPPGNNPHVIGEAIRKQGAIPEAMLAFTDAIETWDEYADPSFITSEIEAMAAQWLIEKSFGHENVFTPAMDVREKHERLRDALRYSPVALSVVAWKEHNGIYVKDQGEPDNHWTMCFARNSVSMIFDTYPPFVKQLDPNYDFGFAKRYHIAKIPKVVLPPQKRWYAGFEEFFREYYQRKL